MTQVPRTNLDELRALLEAGQLSQATFDAAVTAFSAQLRGDGAIAQGQDALAVGSGGVAVMGDNSGIINLGLLIQLGTRSGASGEDMKRAYLARILIQANKLPLFVSDNAGKSILLSSVYTALLTGRSETDTASPERDTKKLSALDVLNAENKLVLLGGPGSGKSTFINFVALAMAGELLGETGLNLATLTAPLPKEEDDRDEPQPQHWDHSALLPVQVTLRDFASQLPASGTQVNAETVCTYLHKQLEQAALSDFYPQLYDEMIRGRVLILFDGLDEVPDAQGRRVQIKQAVQDFTVTFSRCRFLATSRTYAYQHQDWKLDNFTEAHLLPFTLGQIHRFIEAWYGHMVELMRLTETSAQNRAEVLQHTVKRNERIRELAERPLLLTLIAQLQTDKGGALPERREELYDMAVDMLLNQWENMKVLIRADGSKEVEPSLAEWLHASRDDIRKQLNRLAYEAHRDQTQQVGTADIRQSDLICALLNASARREEVKVGLLEIYLRDRAGILAEHGCEMYQFPHRTFQEYLAACHLTDDDFPEKLATLARSDPNRWREVALLAGAKAARGGALGVWALSESLCWETPPDNASSAPADHWGALLAGCVLNECADLSAVSSRNMQKLKRIRAWQLAIMRQNILPAVERALAGRTLAALDDPRAEVMTLDAMQFCYVPPGPFIMGDEDNQHSVNLTTPYFIARYPITVAQWREYVRRGGVTLEDKDSLSGRDNDPVVNTSWKDAMRFCEFLTLAWHEQLPEGFIVTLPSESEWEKAARGGETIPGEITPLSLTQVGAKLATATGDGFTANPLPRRTYPWGDPFDEDNTNAESSVGQTCATGCYPLGCSPYGCEDMSGNVWEWTRSHLKDPDGRENLGSGENVLRVVRGGSWGDHRFYARCAYRNWSPPGGRFALLGFRVVLRSAP